jgi:cystathionine beta-lyase/cystathionine gamma-synthase
MKLCRAGDHIVCGENVYGGTFRLFDKLLQHLGLSFTYVDTRDPQRIADAMTPATRMVHLETPTNPLMRLADITAAAEIAHRQGALVVVDNTVRDALLPAPARPGRRHRVALDHEVPQRAQRHDRRDRRARRRRPGDAAAVHPQRGRRGARARSTRGSPCAARRRCTCAWSATTPTGGAWPRGWPSGWGAERVLYPGLPSHPQHELACRQMTGFGGMIAVELGTRERAAQVLERVQVFSLAESLGGVESLISNPALMTHASVPLERRGEIGLSEGLVRLSCGVEDVEDLLEDVAQAFAGL